MNRREAILMGAIGAKAIKAQTGAPKLTEVYSNNDFQLTGVSVSKSGRVFVNFHAGRPNI